MPLNTLLDIVRYRATIESGFADKLAFTYLNDGESVSGTLTYAQLDEKARRLAAQLQRYTQLGERVLLVYPPSLDYVIAFYACVYAGVIAVPAVSPSNTRTLPRLRSIVIDAQPSVALMRTETLSILSECRENNDELSDMHWLATGPDCDVPSSEDHDWIPPRAKPDDVVFLQYTSGSTGSPKGVMVSHANLIANAELCCNTYNLSEHDVFVFWLPPHHDFGLTGAIVTPVYVGGHCIQFPPAVFMMRPYHWLKLISRYRASITGGPNFAYQLCAKRISDEEKQMLDLRCLATAINGAERIRGETLRQFSAAFSNCGLEPSAITPSYGMAETVLLASANTSTSLGSLARICRLDAAALELGSVKQTLDQQEGVELVMTGVASISDHNIAVVDPINCSCLPDGSIGEVWVSGASVAKGYWGRPSESEHTFRASLAGSEKCWLRTGDLGFLSEGGLYISGRIKEVMIFNGRNIYPQDIEVSVERLDPAFRENGCAAFSVEREGNTRLVIVQELDRRKKPRLKGLLALLQSKLADSHELFSLESIMLVRAGQVPRTSSGKIQRGRCKKLFEDGKIEPIWLWSDSDEGGGYKEQDLEAVSSTELKLLNLWWDAFERRDIGINDNFFRLGGHSLMAVQLVGKLQELFGTELSLASLFRAPTIAELATEIELKNREMAPKLPPLVHSERGDEISLSYAQERFWFLEQYRPKNPFYSVPLALILSGDIAEEPLQRALDRLVERHVPLRTVFRHQYGKASQFIIHQYSVDLRLVDLSDLLEEEIEEQTSKAIDSEAHRSFDLTTGPLMSAVLVRQSDSQHVLLLTFHHIIYDGASTLPLMSELSALYAAERDGHPPELPALYVDYADYVHWEAECLSTDWAEMQIDWWKSYLLDVPTLLEMPTDRPRRLGQDRRGAACHVTLSTELLQSLNGLASKNDVTLFMVLTTALMVLLHRNSGQSDFCLGVMTANRSSECENLIGNFFNVLPLRASLNGDEYFYDLLKNGMREFSEAYERQLPYELILQHTAPHRDFVYTPYLQVVINFHSELDYSHISKKWMNGNGLKISGRHPSSVQHAAFDLKIEVEDTEVGLNLSFEYATELFDASTINRLMGNYQVLLESVVEEPLTKISALPLLTFAERSQLLEDWNNTENEIPTECIHRLFEQQVARTPTATAVEYAGELLTYQELNARANQLAHHLRGLKVGPDTLVALCVERNLDMAVGILGILKAGAAYVPLDPDYPKARLNWMLTDTATPVLLTQKALAEQLPSHDGILYLDAQWPDVAKQPDVDLLTEVTPRHLAYCIYTSGSTGTPKGTANTHEGFSNLAKWYASEELAGSERVMLSSSLSFDLTQKNILGTWLAGGTLIIPNAGAADAEGFRQALFEQMPTRINCAPSAFRAYLSEHPIPESLRLVMLGGEPIDTTLYESLSAQGVALVNSYGPTECADVATSYVQLAGETVSEIPLGRPIPNVQIYLLDNELNPVPVGVTGEIYIAGVGVARGYLNRPELTAECFLPNPFGSAGSRMYKTGDLGRYLANGNLIFLGRADHQVKLRGLRIELGEIEKLLLGCEQVRESAVLLGKSVSGEDYLIAYVVGDFEVEELRSDLLAQLPAYMVPSAWVKLEKLPLNPNGKVDRKALPKPDKSGGEKNSSYVEPRTPTETTLAHIWAEVLGLERVGVHDNFFELGGHSLLAMQLISRVRSQFATTASIRTFFEAPTIAQLATWLDQQTDERVGTGIPRLARRNSTNKSI